MSALFQDCASDIKDKVRGDKELKKWIRNFEDQVDEGNAIDEQDLRQLLNYTREWSGGEELWQRLSKLVQESFAELVLLPALFPLLKSYDVLSSRIDAIAEIRRIEHKEQVKNRQKEISKIRIRLNKGIEQLRKKTHDDLTEMIELLKINTSDTRSVVAQKAESQGLEGFRTLLTAINDVEGDLAQHIIRPVREALLNNQPTHELEEAIAKFVPPSIAEDLRRAYDVASRRLSKFKEEGGFLIRRALKDNSSDIKELDDDEKSVRKLFLLMRRTLTTRAEFQLQTKAQELEDALTELVQLAESQLILLCFEELSGSALQEAIITSYKDQESIDLPALPSQFFTIAPEIKRNGVKETKVVGQEWVTETYTTGSCFKGEQRREIKKDKKETFEYKTVVVPSIRNMAMAWEGGIQKGKDELWDILCHWMTERLDVANDHFNESVGKALHLAEQALKEQLEILEADYTSEIEKWKQIQASKHNATLKSSALKQISSGM